MATEPSAAGTAVEGGTPPGAGTPPQGGTAEAAAAEAQARIAKLEEEKAQLLGQKSTWEQGQQKLSELEARVAALGNAPTADADEQQLQQYRQAARDPQYSAEQRADFLVTVTELQDRIYQRRLDEQRQQAYITAQLITVPDAEREAVLAEVQTASRRGEYLTIPQARDRVKNSNQSKRIADLEKENELLRKGITPPEPPHRPITGGGPAPAGGKASTMTTADYNRLFDSDPQAFREAMRRSNLPPGHKDRLEIV